MNEPNAPIRVMIVEDERVVQVLLEHIIRSDPRLELVGLYRTGEEALGDMASVKPDVISVDIRLPGMNGFELTRTIMRRQPTPIVVVSANVEDEDLGISMNALRAGALAVVEKPVGVTNKDYDKIAERICRSLILMSDVKLVRQRSPVISRSVCASMQPPPIRPLSGQGGYRVLGLVASTGGPNALVEILKHLTPSFPLPIAMVQHITASFLGGFSSWLSATTGFEARVVSDSEPLSPGVIYLAAADHHLEINGLRAKVNQMPPVSGQRPAGTVLLKSMAASHGRNGIGVLLTGMGDDGAEGLAAIRHAGGFTIAEHESTAVVYGMPKVAASLGAVCEQLPLPKIGPRLKELTATMRMIR